MWGLHLGALGALSVYMGVRTPVTRRHVSPLWRWVPFAMVLLGTLLVLFDLTRHLLLDQNLFGRELHMFNSDGSLTPVGRFGVAGTWTGLVLLIFGTCWFVGWDKKIQDWWSCLSKRLRD
jgi:hypothetical protein